MWAMKQFRHCLLGRTFQLMIDHAPLQWLGEQKKEGLLFQWALAMQEFNIEIVYRRGTSNGNADALSRRRETDREILQAAMTTVHPGFTAEEIKQAQQQDDTAVQCTPFREMASTQRLEKTTIEKICPALVPTHCGGWYSVQEVHVPSRSYIGHCCGPCVARNIASAGSEHVP